MIKKTFILLAVAMFALLMSCGDDKVNPDKPETPPQKIESEAKLQVSARDVSTGELVGATVNLHAIGEKEIPQGGAAEFIVPIGTHRLSVSKENYAPIEMTGTVYSQMSGKTLIAKDTAVTAPLYPLEASLSGILTYTNKFGRVVPAAGVTVRVSFDGTVRNGECTSVGEAAFTNLTYEAKTNAAGKYTFSSLPAVGTNNSCGYSIFSVAALPITLSDGTYFSELNLLQSLSVPPSLKKGTVTQIEEKNLTVVNSEFRINKRTESMDSTAVIEIEFNDVANMELVTPSTITVTPAQAVNISWTHAAVSKLTIAPIGKWIGNAANTVVVGISDLKAAKGQGATTALTATVNVKLNQADMSGEDGIVKGLVYYDTNSVITKRLNGNTEIVKLSWNKVAGATGYKVWVAKKVAVGEPEFVVATPSGDLSTKNNVVSGDFQFSKGGPVKLGGDTYIFKVQPYTTLSFSTEGSLELAEEIAVSDTTRPNLLTSGSIYDSYIDGGSLVSAKNEPNTTLNADLITTKGQDFTIKFLNASGSSLVNQIPSVFEATPNANWNNGTWNDWATASLHALLAATKAPTRPSSVETDSGAFTWGRVFFNEPMNTKKKLEIKVTSPAVNPVAKMTIGYEWDPDETNTPGQNLGLSVRMADGAALPAAAYDWVYEIIGLEDMAGNEFAYTYYPNYGATTGQSSAGTTIKTVALRFKATITAPHACDAGFGSAACQTFCADAANAADETCLANVCKIQGSLTTACQTFCSAPANALNPDCANKCDVFGDVSSQCCSVYATGSVDGCNYWDYCVDATIAAYNTPTCTGNLGDIFGTPVPKAYCQLFGATTLTWASAPATCATTYDYCTDINPSDASCVTVHTCTSVSDPDCANLCTGSENANDTHGDTDFCKDWVEQECKATYSTTNTVQCPLYYAASCNASYNVTEVPACGGYYAATCKGIAGDVNACTVFFNIVCDGNPVTNTYCPAFCEKSIAADIADVTTNICESNANNIFASDPLKAYCRRYAALDDDISELSDLSAKVTACEVSGSITNVCQIMGNVGSECAGYCKTDTYNFFGEDICFEIYEDADALCNATDGIFKDENLCAETCGDDSNESCLCDESTTGSAFGVEFFCPGTSNAPYQFSPIQQTKLKKVAKR